MSSSCVGRASDQVRGGEASIHRVFSLKFLLWKAVSGLAMAPRGFNISAPWRHRPDRDVSRRIPGQTLRHCHDACIAPDHGAQEQAVRARRRSLRHCAPWGGTRHPAMGRRARTRHGRCWAAWAVPVGPGCTPRIPEGGKPDWRFSGGRGMRRVAAVGPARQGVRSSSAVAPCGLRKAGQGPGRQAQGCAAQGGGRAERNRSWSVLSGPEDSGPSCLFFFPACRGRYAACGSGPTLVCP